MGPKTPSVKTILLALFFGASLSALAQSSATPPIWNNSFDEKDILIETCQDIGDGIIKIRAFYKVGASPKAVFDTLSDQTSYDLWMPFLAEQSIYEQNSSSTFDLPIITNRYLHYRVTTIRDSDSYTITLNDSGPIEKSQNIHAKIDTLRTHITAGATRGWSDIRFDMRISPGGDIPTMVATMVLERWPKHYFWALLNEMKRRKVLTNDAYTHFD